MNQPQKYQTRQDKPNLITLNQTKSNQSKPIESNNTKPNQITLNQTKSNQANQIKYITPNLTKSH
jgi:hypothetical protein